MLMGNGDGDDGVCRSLAINTEITFLNTFFGTNFGTLLWDTFRDTFRDTFLNYLCHISSMQGSVVRVGRVISGLDHSEEGMTVRRVQTKVADQTW